MIYVKPELIRPTNSNFQTSSSAVSMRSKSKSIWPFRRLQHDFGRQLFFFSKEQFQSNSRCSFSVFDLTPVVTPMRSWRIGSCLWHFQQDFHNKTKRSPVTTEDFNGDISLGHVSPYRPVWNHWHSTRSQAMLQDAFSDHVLSGVPLAQSTED